MSIKIAIPSHDRVDMFQDKTLAFLKKHKFPMSDVYVFSTPAYYNAYKEIGDKWGFNVVKSKSNLLAKRNHFISYFPAGQKVVEMDDDVEDIQKIGGTGVTNFKKFLADSFKALGQNQGLWGVNANCNAFHATKGDKFGAHSLCNTFIGYVNDKRINLTIAEKHDMDRLLQFIKLGLPTLKRGDWGIKTKYWTNKGGIATDYDIEKRKKVQSKDANDLMKKFPNCCWTKTRPNGIVDIRLKRHPFGKPE